MAKYTASEIADTIIHLSRGRAIDITNLKLQKLLYYAQAWNLVFTGQPLFRDSIEAWVHGPVVPSVFRKFKEYRWNTIDCPVFPLGDSGVIDHVNSVLDAYGNLPATRLERLTHREEPWRLARGNRPVDEPSSAVIDTDVMKRFYSSLLPAQP